MSSTAQVIPFQFEAREVRTLLIGDQPWFCAADVCAVLGYANSRKAVVDNCREAGVTASDIRSGGQKRRVTFISEGNLYRLIIKSRKDEAQRFESWVCDEVLPTIRKHGRYEDTSGKMDTLLGQTIGTDGFHVLGAIIAGKVRVLPAPVQRRAKHKLWAQVHAAFNVRSAEDIPAAQLDAARNFVAAYAIEGEWIEREKPAQSLTLSEDDLALLYTLCANVMDLVQVGERLRPALNELHSITLINVPKNLESCRTVVGYLYRFFGQRMENETKKRGLFIDWINLAAAEDHSQPIHLMD